MGLDRLEKLRTKAFFKLLGEASDLPERVMRDKFKKENIKTYRGFLAAMNRMIMKLMDEGWTLEDAKTQASILYLAMVMKWEPGPLARRLLALDIKGLDDLSGSVLSKGMEAYEKKYGDESVNIFRPTALQTWHSMLMDLWPDSPAAITDFWLTDQKHYEALYYPIRRGEITPEDMDRVLGDPEAITELVNSMPSNPHKGIVFGEPPPGGHPDGWDPTQN